MKALLLVASCAILPGCAVQLAGNQSASGGAATTATSSAVVASTSAGNARVAFSFGQPVSPAAPGGQLSVGGGGAAAAVLLVGVVMVEFLNSLGGTQPPVIPLPADARISHTCSCYGYQPVAENDKRPTKDERR